MAGFWGRGFFFEFWVGFFPPTIFTIPAFSSA